MVRVSVKVVVIIKSTFEEHEKNSFGLEFFRRKHFGPPCDLLLNSYNSFVVSWTI